MKRFIESLINFLKVIFYNPKVEDTFPVRGFDSANHYDTGFKRMASSEQAAEAHQNELAHDDLLAAAKRVKEVVDQIDPSKSSYRSDPIKNGRSLTWYGTTLAGPLKNNKLFDMLTQTLSKEGLTVYVKSNETSTKIHLRRKKI